MMDGWMDIKVSVVQIVHNNKPSLACRLVDNDDLFDESVGGEDLPDDISSDGNDRLLVGL